MNNILSEADTNAVLDIIIEQLDVEKSQLTPEARLEEDLGADSLDVMEITMAVEGQFDISVSDEAAERISTVGDVLEALSGLMPQRRA